MLTKFYEDKRSLYKYNLNIEKVLENIDDRGMDWEYVAILISQAHFNFEMNNF